MRGCRRSAYSNNEDVPIGPTNAAKANFASAHAVCTPTHSVPIYYNGVILEFRTCTYAVRGMKFDRNVLSRMDLKLSEDSKNNTVVRHGKA